MNAALPWLCVFERISLQISNVDGNLDRTHTPCNPSWICDQKLPLTVNWNKLISLNGSC